MARSNLSRRSFLKVSGGALGMAALAACASPAQPGASGGGDSAPDAEVPYLVYWAPQHFIEAQNEYHTESAKLAAAENGFEVEVQLFPWGDYHQKQAAAIEAGTLPDAMLGVSVSQQAAMGILSDVSDIFEEIAQAAVDSTNRISAKSRSAANRSLSRSTTSLSSSTIARTYWVRQDTKLR